MLMQQHGAWQLMLHANAFAANTQQQANSPRNRDAFFSTNWIMPMAQRSFGAQRADENGTRGGQLTLRTMISLEPATIAHRNYPELFQQGETAFGAPIIDGQHPHDFLMELAALYDLPLSRHTLLSLYAAPVGDPAIGPTAYPHRMSASENPIAALGHHQQDSTHIAFNVFTGGLTWRIARVELSGFHGAEPTEARWHPEPSPNGHAIDSVATRLTVSPTPDWTAQYSITRTSKPPKPSTPRENQQRQTASVMYHHTLRAAQPLITTMNFDANPPATPTTSPDSMPGMNMQSTTPPRATKSTAMPGMNMHSMYMTPDPVTDISATASSGAARAHSPPAARPPAKKTVTSPKRLLRFRTRNYLWTRLENAGRSNELRPQTARHASAKFSGAIHSRTSAPTPSATTATTLSAATCSPPPDCNSPRTARPPRCNPRTETTQPQKPSSSASACADECEWPLAFG